MQNYSELIIDSLVGSTPKQKWEYLQRLESDNLSYIVKLNLCKTLFEGLASTSKHATIEDVYSFISATHEAILKP